MSSLRSLTYFQFCQQQRRFIWFLLAAGFWFGLGLSLLFPFKYQATVHLLLIQKSALTVDAYTASRSLERLGKTIGSIVRTDSFQHQVLRSGFPFADDFGVTLKKRRHRWRKTVDAQLQPNAPILRVTVWHPQSEQAVQLARALSAVLVEHGGDYLGVKDQVSIKEVDSVLVSNYPVKPRVFLNILGMVWLFFIISLILLWFEYQHRIDNRVS